MRSFNVARESAAHILKKSSVIKSLLFVQDLRSYFLPWKATVSASNLACIGRHILE